VLFDYLLQDTTAITSDQPDRVLEMFRSFYSLRSKQALLQVFASWL